MKNGTSEPAGKGYTLYTTPPSFTPLPAESRFYCGWKLLPVNLERNINPYWPCEKPVIKGSLESQYFMSVACLLLLHELFLQVCHCPVSVCNGKKAWTLVHWNEVTLQGGRKHLSIKYFFCQVPEKERQGIQMSVGKTGCHFLATHSTPFLRTLGGNFPSLHFSDHVYFQGNPILLLLIHLHLTHHNVFQGLFPVGL